MIAEVYAPRSTDQSALTGEGRSDTSSLARFGGRFFCFYLLLVWLPWSLLLLGGVSVGWWLDVGQWSITHILLLRLPEHFADSPTASNVLTHYASTAVFVVVSTALATVWLAVDRRDTTYPIAFACAFVLARFMLAFFMMSYGWGKVLPSQFGLMARCGISTRPALLDRPRAKPPRPVQSDGPLADTAKDMSERAVGWILFALLSGVLAGSILVFAASATCRCDVVPTIQAAI